MLEHEGAGHSGRFAIVNGQVILADEIVVGRSLVVDGATIAGISDEGALSQNIECVDATAGPRRCFARHKPVPRLGATGHTA